MRHAAAGVTRIVVAQRVATITDADQIIVLDEGRVVGRGTHAELLAGNETYKAIDNAPGDRYGNARDLCLGLEVVTAQGEVWDGLKGLRRIHHAGAGAHINRHPHGLQHFLPARPLLHGGFGMEGDATVAAGRDPDRQSDQLLGFRIQRIGLQRSLRDGRKTLHDGGRAASQILQGGGHILGRLNPVLVHGAAPGKGASVSERRMV